MKCIDASNGAGGGSGFVAASATDTTNEAGIRAGSGLVTISYNATPPNKDACKNGGWANFVDDHGNAFKNQGQCVAWVEHNT